MENRSPSNILKQKTRRLISAFLNGEEKAFPEQYTEILDNYFRDSFGESEVGPMMGVAENPYAIIALGGYGREEQCIHSDIDLLFLFDKQVPQEGEELIKEVVYPLWDLGLEIGYATRSLNECISLSAKDIEVLTSLLDARFLCGASFLYSDLTAQMKDKILLKNTKKTIEQLVAINRQRHTHFGDSAYLLEPNLKEGQGGIRDYHTMLWIAKIQAGIRQPRDLKRCGYLTHSSFLHLMEALTFIWKVRSHLHHLTGRKCDQLYLEHQTLLAETLNFSQTNGQRPVERFLGKLHGCMESLKQQYLSFLLGQGYDQKHKRHKKEGMQTLIQGLEVDKGMLFFKSSEAIPNRPDLLMDIFEESRRLNIPLSGEAKNLINDFLYLVDDNFRKNPAMAQRFERLLASPEGQFNVMSEMLDTGFLSAFIPPFKKIINRIQYDEYHLYPVDRHSLLTLRMTKNFGKQVETTETPLCHDIYRTLPNKKPLLWAALLHDIGKGVAGGGHSQKGAAIAGGLLEGFGLKQKDVDTITFLIEHHLLLANTATRRDINDEETALFCAREVKTVGRLKMLYLLTVADSISTGPKAWNEWTAALLRSLFFNILNILNNGELASKVAIAKVQKKKNAVIASLPSPYTEKEVSALMDVMSPRYLLYASTAEIRDHIALYHASKNQPFAWHINQNAVSDTRTVTVCTHDRPGLFSKIAGTFTLNGLNILNCQSYTWRNNAALDIFEVEPPPDRLFEEERWHLIQKDLHAVLAGDLDLGAALGKKEANTISNPRLSGRLDNVIIDNNSSSFFTIIEVYTYDSPGLLYRITDTLFRNGLDIWVAKVATKADQVVDVFYVRDFDGQKVDSPFQENMLQEALAAVLQDNA